MADKRKKINRSIVPVENIRRMIFTIRGVQVMMDLDFASVYGVEDKSLNENVKRKSSCVR